MRSPQNVVSDWNFAKCSSNTLLKCQKYNVEVGVALTEKWVRKGLKTLTVIFFCIDTGNPLSNYVYQRHWHINLTNMTSDWPVLSTFIAFDHTAIRCSNQGNAQVERTWRTQQNAGSWIKTQHLSHPKGSYPDWMIVNWKYLSKKCLTLYMKDDKIISVDFFMWTYQL